MCDQKTWSMRFVSLLGVVLAVGVVLALGSAAASARPAQAVQAVAAHKELPVRFYTLSRIDATTGKVTLDEGAQEGGRLHKRARLGTTPFSLLDHTNGAFGALDQVFSSADGSKYQVVTQAPNPKSTAPGTPRGGVSHLDEFQAYRKQSGDASLTITITRVIIQAIDDEGFPSGCPPPENRDCPLVRGIVRFHARAYAASAGGDFFNVGGTAFLEGHRGGWFEDEVTDADFGAAVWNRNDFDLDESFDRVPRKHHHRPFFVQGPTAQVMLEQPLEVHVPLGSVRDDELFAVHVTLEVQATDDRAGETTALAFIDDPQHLDQPLLKSQGLQLLGKPNFREPKPTSPPAASCPTGPSPHAGTLQFSSPAYSIGEADGFPTVIVTRKGGSNGEISATMRTKSGSAKAGQDFKATTTRVTFKNHDTSPRFVEIPIREDQAAESQENFTVSLSHPQCGKLGKQRQASVTILDDDQPPPPPPPTFTIGGAVDGLVGSGLVLTNLGPDVAVSGNGTFTFPVTAVTNQPYEVVVRTQPTNPTQVCTVQNGKGTVGNSNVTDIAVHCAAPLPPPLGLDVSFGTGGFASTPVSGLGQGNAVVIQPTGGIVTAGVRTVGILGHTDFALTRHDESGNLDHSFGTDGIATTDLGGDSDLALGAAVLPDNGIVAVGRTDVRGPQKTDFGVVRYLPDGTPNPNFGNGGIVTTPFSGMGAQANAVAVQPDGKIVVAGFALSNAINFDFAVARYNPDGSLDDGFGAHGIATADVGGENDDATGLALQSDGKIVLGGITGPTGEDVGLARFEPNGTLDPTFGNLGTSDVKIGLGVDVNGVALQSGGGILIAGSMFSNTSMSRDFLLAGFRNDGTLNLGFGHFGFVTTDFGEGDDFAENLVVDDQDHVVVVGRAASGTIEDLALAGYKPDGSPDDLGRGGIFTVDFHGKGDFGQDLAIDSQNRIIAVGGTAGGDSGLALTRVFR
jgi:uncharacterized delta-60 repeat protein